MNNFQPINNGETGLSARTKINNLGNNALGPEHNQDTSAHGNTVLKTVAQNLSAEQQRTALSNIDGEQSGTASTAVATHNNAMSAHVDFMSRGRIGMRSDKNSFSATETDNIGNSTGANAYRPGSTNATKYIGANYVQKASDLKAIITKYGGSETYMPGYFGFCIETESGESSVMVSGDKYNSGFFSFSLNMDENKDEFPFKIAVFSTRGVKHAYFRNGTTPIMTAWQSIADGEETEITGYREDWTSPDQATMNLDGNLMEWGPIKSAAREPSSFLIHNLTGYSPSGIPPIIASQMQIFSDGTMRTRTGTPISDMGWEEWKEIAPNATTAKAGMVTLAANTGNSTDAGKVIALDDNGLISREITKEKDNTITMLSQGSGISLGNTDYDVYNIVSVLSGSPNPPRIYIPTSTDNRDRIKIRLNIASANANTNTVLIDNGGAITSYSTPGGTSKWIYFIFEKFIGTWRKTFEEQVNS